MSLSQYDISSITYTNRIVRDKLMQQQYPFTDITVEEYDGHFVQERADYHLIDVREVQEFQQGHLPGAVNLPLSELQMRFNEVQRDKPIVLVCRSGGRSAMAAEFFAALGYTDLYNIAGGTMDWARKGLPIEIPE
jgi:rhodanese-related sulfurtransferase